LRHATKEYAAARLSTRSGQVSVVRMMFGIAVVGEILLRSDNLLVMS